jgi:hypothetical protein
MIDVPSKTKSFGITGEEQKEGKCLKREEKKVGCQKFLAENDEISSINSTPGVSYRLNPLMIMDLAGRGWEVTNAQES